MGRPASDRPLTLASGSRGPAIWLEYRSAGGIVILRVTAGYLRAASYCSATLDGMRPRSLTAMPCSFAHARIWLPRS